MKTCKKCGIKKPLSAFKNERKNKDGKSGTCKECHKIANRKWQRANKEKVRKYQKKWRKNNPEKARISDFKSYTKRRDNAEGTEISLSVEEWDAIVKHFGGCAICGDTDNLHKDHFIPIATGHGDTTIENIIPLCSTHNIQKKDQHPIMWLYSIEENFDPYDIISYLADQNGMEYDEYCYYVDCVYFGIDPERYDEYYGDQIIADERHDELESYVAGDEFWVSYWFLKGFEK